MTTKAEWTCRREEIPEAGRDVRARHQAPATDGDGDGDQHQHHGQRERERAERLVLRHRHPALGCGSAPYPAIIGYGGVAPLDTTVIDGEGVATINFDPMSVGAEGDGHGPNQTGAFYSLYAGRQPDRPLGGVGLG